MAKPGRKALPANVVKLHGNRSQLTKAELAEREASEIKPHPIEPKRPTDLLPDERVCWDAHQPELSRLALFTVLDPISFRLQVCQPYAVACEAWRAMRPRNKDGTLDRRRRGLQVVVPDPDNGGLKRHPAMLVWKTAVDEYRSGCQHFGLTPLSRVGLRPSAPVGSTPDDDDDQDFFD